MMKALLAVSWGSLGSRMMMKNLRKNGVVDGSRSLVS